MEKLITAKIKELTKNGKLDEIVTKQATTFIQEMVRDVLSSYGDVSDKYKKMLKENVLSGFEKLDFVQYSKTLADLVEAELNKSIIEIGIAPAKEMINKFIGSLEKKEWKLSEIIEKFKEEEVIPDNRDSSGEIELITEVSEYGTIYIAFDKDNTKKNHRYLCKYRLMIDSKTKKLYSPSIDDKIAHPIKECGGLCGFDLFLFKLYATNCTIECDIDNIDPSWSTYND